MVPPYFEQIFRALVSFCRGAIFKEECTFSNEFSIDCQEKSVPSCLKILSSMILYGSNLSQDVTFSQECLSLGQLFVYNAKKLKRNASIPKRHSSNREPPLPVGLNIHSQTRNKKLIDQLSQLGFSVKYDRVLELEKETDLAMCKQFEAENVVCPSNLKKNIFTVGALDNIDHNLSSTSASSSFHGTGISVTHFPRCLNPGVVRHKCNSTRANERTVAKLPDKYSVVPAVTKLPSSVLVPVTICPTSQRSSSETQVDTEKADNPAMVKHGLDLLKTLTDFLNPGQTPVLACDCPIFAIGKRMQWKFPELYDEDKFIIMFGGLHLEKALWNVSRDLLQCSGWSEALVEAEIATSGTADSFLKVPHITRTRHAHQVTALALETLQHTAYVDQKTSVNFESWRLGMIESSPTFQFWDIILHTELSILAFIRAHRENKFALYVDCLDSLIYLFFALDHFNYSRWVSVHVRDMNALRTLESDFQNHWVVQKTQKRFLKIPIDQVHEQKNCKIKGKRGVIGITENQAALQKWLVIDLSSQHFKDIERLTVILYDKTSTLEFVNECRKQFFAQRGNLESIPPTQDALLLYVQRTAYQTGIWATCRTETPDVPTPDKWGWKILDGYNYQPIWMTIPEAAKVCTELIKC
ncbi:hypothetical protein GQR58_015133 [Nymphon striatum]|nr:hypothetical protein GQR58_015133 [Nymphon striatum]